MSLVNLPRLFAVLRARWVLLFLPLVAALCITAAVVVTYPPTYKATAAVIINTRQDPVSALTGSGANTFTVELDILTSDRVAQRVVRNLKLADSGLRRLWEKDPNASTLTPEIWIANFLRMALEIIPPKTTSSNIVTISYTAGDPKFAEAVANGFVRAYMETSVELKIDPSAQYNKFFTAQIENAREALEQAQARLSNFQREKGLLFTDGRLDVEVARLTALSQELTGIQAARTDSVSRENQAHANLTNSQDVQNNGGVSSLKNQLNQAEAKLAELTIRYGENYPQVQEARATVRDLRKRLETESRNVANTLSSNVAVQVSREAEVRAQLEAQRQRVLQLKEVRDEGSVLERDVENAQRAYDSLFSRARQTDLESKNQLSMSTFLTPATSVLVPLKPAKLLMKGVAAGLSCGLFFILLMEYYDRRLRTTSDVIFDLGLPVVGLIPSAVPRSQWFKRLGGPSVPPNPPGGSDRDLPHDSSDPKITG